MSRDARHERSGMVAAIVLTISVGVFGVVPWEVTAQEASKTTHAEPVALGSETCAGEDGQTSAAEVYLPPALPRKPADSETGAPRSVTVRELLERAAGSPLGPGEAGLLRAVAELIEKEQAAPGNNRMVKPHDAVMSPRPYPAPVPPSPLGAGPKPAPSDPRSSVVFRLRNAPAADVARALEKLLSGEREAGRWRADEAVLVSEPVSNCVLLSGTPEVVESLSRIVENLDIAPPMVMIELQIAELLPSSRDSQTTDSANDESAANETPDMEEDGAAWLAWAKKHGRLKTLCRPQIVTRDNQPAHLQIGSQVPTDPAATGAEKGKTTDPAFVGLIVKLVPRITPDGLVIMEINVEVSSIVKTNPPGNPLIASGTMQTILTAKDGQTITVSGPIQRREDGDSQLVVAVTPRINPQL